MSRSEPWTPVCGSPSRSASPWPSPRRGGALSTFDDLQGKTVVGVRAARVAVVLRDRKPVAGSLCEAHGAGDDGGEDLRAEVRPHLALDIAGEARAPVVHRQQQAG